MNKEIRYNPTPNGGDYSEIYYLDDDKKPISKERATQVIIRELKEDGALVKETVMKKYK